MKQWFSEIREPKEGIPAHKEAAVIIGITAAGLVLGIFQKWLDSMAVNELPALFQFLDLGNYFGRFAVWILLGTLISVCAATPLKASIHTSLFLISMVAGYYLYCRFVLGFLPVRYMLVWVVLAFFSVFPAYLCWYAKGNGMPAVLISAGILGVLLAQAVFLIQGIRMTHLPEVLTWLAGVIILRRKPKEFALEMALSVAVALVYQLFIPYWG